MYKHVVHKNFVQIKKQIVQTKETYLSKGCDESTTAVFCIFHTNGSYCSLRQGHQRAVIAILLIEQFSNSIRVVLGGTWAKTACPRTF